MSTWTIGLVTLPGDLQWIDEFTPARKRSESTSLAGSSIVQFSTQVSGIPITLQTPPGVFVTRKEIADLTAMLNDPATDVFQVGHPDGRSFSCRFSTRDGLAVDWANTYFRSHPVDSDAWHTLTLRLMTA